MATGNAALSLVRTHNAGCVFLSREKPTVRHALVRLTPFPPSALTCCVGSYSLLAWHRGSSPQERARVIPTALLTVGGGTERRVLEETCALPAEQQ